MRMSHWKAMRHVILPQAVRNILPAMCNEFVTIIKETSILGMVGIVELMFRAQSIAKRTYILSWSRMSSRPSCILSLCSRCRRSSRLWKGG